MKFHYIASQADGRVTEGDIESEDTARVLKFLGAKGLRPISVQQIGTLETAGIGRSLFAPAINPTDKIFLTKYLALMLRVGTDLLKALEILIADFDKQSVKALLLEMKISLSKGQPFYTTFQKYPKIFSSVFINMVKAGEVSGNLEMVFQNLSTMLEKEQDLRRKIKAALVYPVLLMAMSFLVLIFLVVFALPKIAALFSSGGFNPPFFSRVVFAIGLFIGDHVILLFIALLTVFFGGGYFLFKTQPGKRFFASLLESLPVVKGVVQKIIIQRFATTLGSLMKAGLSIVDSLTITADTLGHEKFSLALRRIANEGVARGLTLGDAFKRETVFPQVITNLVAVSEKAGHLDEILATLSEFYDSEIDSSLKMLVSFIEPVMLSVIGIIIAFIALSIILPIYQLVGGIGAAT